MQMWQGLLKEYSEYLPVTAKTPQLSLQEGNTPLIPLDTLSESLGVNIFAKFEGLNPSGSFKDRGMVLAVAKAKEEGAHTVICASTGNTSASAAAYASRLGMTTIVIIPEGNVALGKVAQAIVHGARIISIEGNFDDALKIVRKIAEDRDGVTLVNSLNPYRLEGQKTASFEVIEQLGESPDYLAIPVGNAGNISAYWKGFKEYHDKKGHGLPKMYGFEAEGAAAIVSGEVVKDPETVGTAIRIGNPTSWQLAENARDESGGLIDSVTDEELLGAYNTIARTEGIFAEPASAASIAGLMKTVAQGLIAQDSTVVCVLTGNGLKDPDTAIDEAEVKPKVLPNDEGKIIDYIESLNDDE